jgi:hypothetical protein
VATGAECSLHGENGSGPLTGGPSPVKIYFQFFKLQTKLQIQKESFPLIKKYSDFACC